MSTHPTRIAARGLVLPMVTTLLLATWSGCSQTIRRPSWLHPGPAAYQRYNATQFDPYPQNDMAPEIVGGRPLGYAKPPPEVVRARQQRPFGPTSQAAPMGPAPVRLPSTPLY